MIHTEAHMQRHRIGARGNVTCFPLPWEQIIDQLQQFKTEKPLLPRLPGELADLVSILLKTSGTDEEKKQLKHTIAHGFIRRDVVVSALEQAHRRGHPAYRHLDLPNMRERAKQLPVSGVPDEILKLLPHDNNLEKVIPQKAATPVGGRVPTVEAFQHVRPHAVLQEQCGTTHTDLNERHVESLKHVTELLNNPAVAHGPAMPGLIIKTGEDLVNQYRPNFFSIAFPF